MRTFLFVISILSGLVTSCSMSPERSEFTPLEEPRSSTVPLDAVFTPPSFSSIPGDQRGELIRIGYEVIVHTQDQATPYVGNQLNCTNCHLDGGLEPNAMSYVGLSRLYPEYRAKTGRTITLEDRINQCFEQNLNGKAMPQDSYKLRAIVAYIDWLSNDVPKASRVEWRGLSQIRSSRQPDPANGKKLFAARCQFCHGGDGQGTLAGPPLWGPGSFTTGSGMARVSVAASFIKANMPRTRGWALSDDESFDVAAYIASQPRPGFSGKIND
jgi:thiosulfate dehydrogenase